MKTLKKLLETETLNINELMTIKGAVDDAKPNCTSKKCTSSGCSGTSCSNTACTSNACYTNACGGSTCNKNGCTSYANNNAPDNDEITNQYAL